MSLPPVERIAVLTPDDRYLRINPGKDGPGPSEWVVEKRGHGWFVKFARSGIEREATGAEIVAALAIVDLLAHLKTPHAGCTSKTNEGG